MELVNLTSLNLNVLFECFFKCSLKEDLVKQCLTWDMRELEELTELLTELQALLLTFLEPRLLLLRLLLLLLLLLMILLPVAKALLAFL